MLIGTDHPRKWLKLAATDTVPNDNFEALINAAQSFIDDYTGRQLEAEHYESDPQFSFYDGNGENWIYVKQFPLSSVENVWVDGDRVFGDGQLIASDDIFFDVNGKIYSEGGKFTKGKRNVKIDYKAGYNPVPILGGTANPITNSTYAIPYDLQQTMTEMVVQAYKEGLTSVHTLVTEDRASFRQLFTQNSVWKITLDRYVKYDLGLENTD